MQRRIRNVVNNYTATEVKVREATSNDPWGPSSILMSEISTLSFDVLSRGEVMGIIWKRLNDHGKNWRHVYKSLVLLNFLVRNGSDWMVRECRDNIIIIQTLRDFQHLENGLDCGLNIREAAKKLFELLKDDQKLREERYRAHKSKAGDYRIYSSSIGDLTSETSYHTPSYNHPLEIEKVHSTLAHTPQLSTTQKPSSLPKQQSIPNNNNNQNGGGDDDDDELKMALALSREEHDEEVKKRRNDEVRLKMALEESKRTAQLDKQRTTKVYAPSLVDQDGAWDHPHPDALENPWNFTNDDASITYSMIDKPLPSINLLGGLMGEGEELGYNNQSQMRSKSRDDEFDEIIHRSAFKDDLLNLSINNSGNDWLKPLAYQSEVSKSTSLGDLLNNSNNDILYPMRNDANNNSSNNTNNNNDNTSNNTNNDNNNNNNNKDPFDLFDNNTDLTNNNLVNFADNTNDVKTKKMTAEEFLGDNAKLVNLDELVVMPTKPESSNPFAMTTTLPNKPLPNPFNINKQPIKVPLNQLQTSTNPYPNSNPNPNLQPNPNLELQSQAFMNFDNSTYNQSMAANQILASQSASGLPPLLPQQPPIAFNNQYNPFM